jgi:hypothetical protein
VIEGGDEDIGINFLSPAANTRNQQICFGDSNNNKVGRLVYDHSVDKLRIFTDNTEQLQINSVGDVLLNTDQATIGMNTSDGSDNKGFTLCGGSDASQSRGSLVGLFGNEHSSFPGVLALRAGNVTGGRIEFSASGAEVGRIDGSGRLLLGTTTEGSAGADEFTINTPSGHGGMTIRNDSSSNGNIWFSDGTSGAAEYAGYVQYDHNADALKVASGAALALTLDSSQNATFAGGITATPAASSNDLGLTITPAGGTTASYFKVLGNRDSGGAAGRNGGAVFIDSNYYATTSTIFNIAARATNVFSILGNGNVTAHTGTVSDSKGNLRDVPANEQNGSYTLVAADAGKVVRQESTGVTINTSVMTQGAVVTIINHSGSDQTITQGSGFTLYNTADASTGNRTLAQRGMATIWYSAQDVGYISGAGLS